MTEQVRPQSSQQRRASRHIVSLDGTLSSDGAVVACGIMNLSLGGALISSSTDFTIGHTVRLTFALAAPVETIDTLATVRWAEGHSRGLQFNGLRAREVWALGKYFAQLRGGAR